MELSRVQIGSFQHILPIVISLVLLLFMLKFARKRKEDFKRQFIHRFACFISLFLVSFHLYHIFFGSYNFKEDLPLFLCSFMTLIIPLFTYKGKYWLFEILVFWIIAGTLQGVITPDIAFGFPSFDYFRYWLVHLGLLIIIFYYIKIFNYKPTFKSVLKSFGVLQCYIAVMILLNTILKSNYGYLNRKPESTSVLDFLGDWPFYIMKADLIIFGVFFIIYTVFVIFDKFLKATK